MHQHHIGNWSDHFLLYIRRGVLVLSVGQEQSHLLHQIHYQGCMSENNHLDHLFYLYLHQRLYHLDRFLIFISYRIYKGIVLRRYIYHSRLSIY